MLPSRGKRKPRRQQSRSALREALSKENKLQLTACKVLVEGLTGRWVLLLGRCWSKLLLLLARLTTRPGKQKQRKRREQRTPGFPSWERAARQRNTRGTSMKAATAFTLALTVPYGRLSSGFVQLAAGNFQQVDSTRRGRRLASHQGVGAAPDLMPDSQTLSEVRFYTNLNAVVAF